MGDTPEQPPRPHGHHVLSPEELAMGARASVERRRRGAEALQALEQGKLIPVGEERDDRASCPILIIIRAAARKLAGLPPEPLNLPVLPPAAPVPESLLALQRIDPSVRARLLDDA